MKRILILAVWTLLGIGAHAQSLKPAIPRDEKIEAKIEVSKAKVVLDGLTSLLMPVMILVFTTFGITTASESAAVAVVYALVVGTLVYRELKWKHILAALKKTAIMTATEMRRFLKAGSPKTMIAVMLTGESETSTSINMRARESLPSFM